MEGFKDKNKLLFLLYEMLGMMILTIAFNMSHQYAILIIVVSIWAWDVSAAHFNPAITFGTFVMDTKDMSKLKDNLVPFLLLWLVQMIGALAGILVTFLCSHIVYNGDAKTITPSVSPLCPTGSIGGCLQNGLGWNLFFIEVVASFVLVFTYLIVRNVGVQGDSAQWMAYVGPILLYFIYGGALSITGVTANGPLNPALALELWFWSLGAYNNIPDPTNFPL